MGIVATFFRAARSRAISIEYRPEHAVAVSNAWAVKPNGTCYSSAIDGDIENLWSCVHELDNEMAR